MLVGLLVFLVIASAVIFGVFRWQAKERVDLGRRVLEQVSSSACELFSPAFGKLGDTVYCSLQDGQESAKAIFSLFLLRLEAMLRRRVQISRGMGPRREEISSVRPDGIAAAFAVGGHLLIQLVEGNRDVVSLYSPKHGEIILPLAFLPVCEMVALKEVAKLRLEADPSNKEAWIALLQDVERAFGHKMAA